MQEVPFLFHVLFLCKMNPLNSSKTSVRLEYITQWLYRLCAWECVKK